MLKIPDAEIEVLKVIWDRGEATSSEIIQDLKDYSWKYNTIRTLIKRLHQKGAIEIISKNGKAYTYRATLDEADYKNELTKDLLKKLYNNSMYEFLYDYFKGTEEEKHEAMRKLIEDVEKQIK